jgi:hypothetical protein
VSALTIRPDAPDERVALAAGRLERCEGRVVLEGVATLSPMPDSIECAITEPMPGASRCEEEYRVLVENAARALRASRLGRRLPQRPLHWVVVAEAPAGPIELWREEDA